jgi:hypothetical protein
LQRKQGFDRINLHECSSLKVEAGDMHDILKISKKWWKVKNLLNEGYRVIEV